MGKLTITLSDGIYRQLRIRCVETDMKIKDAVSGAIFAWLHPASVRVQNPAYLYDPDADYAARLEAGDDPDAAKAYVTARCAREDIEDWWPGAAWARPFPGGNQEEEIPEPTIDTSDADDVTI